MNSEIKEFLMPISQDIIHNTSSKLLSFASSNRLKNNYKQKKIVKSPLKIKVSQNLNRTNNIIYDQNLVDQLNAQSKNINKNCLAIVFKNDVINKLNCFKYERNKDNKNEENKKIIGGIGWQMDISNNVFSQGHLDLFIMETYNSNIDLSKKLLKFEEIKCHNYLKINENGYFNKNKSDIDEINLKQTINAIKHDKIINENYEEFIQSMDNIINAVKNMTLIVSPNIVSKKSICSTNSKDSLKPNFVTEIGIQNMTSIEFSPRFIRKYDNIFSISTFQKSKTLLKKNLNKPQIPFDNENDNNEKKECEQIIWRKGNLLGRGAYGKVWCALTNQGELIAVKMIELNVSDFSIAEKKYFQIKEEVEFLKTMKHSNIVDYLGTSFEDNIIAIFMEFVPGGSIANLLARFGCLEEEVISKYTKQILYGVEFLHSNNVIHRDIKGANVMVMHTGIIKLIDFGCAKKLCFNIDHISASKDIELLLKSMCGTPYWMAPEMFQQIGHSTKADIWSIGCTLYEMATRNPPWASYTPTEAIYAIGNNLLVIPNLPSTFSATAQKFFELCLISDQNLRPSASCLQNHPFLNINNYS